MPVTMGDDRSLAWLKACGGGVLAGLALSAPAWCPSGPWLMLPALALLWGLTGRAGAASLWGGLAVLISHRWLLALHPLTWVGVPEPLSLPVAVGVWMVCAFAAAGLVGAWAWLAGRCDPRRWSSMLLLACLWGAAEVVLAGSPLFWMGVGGSLLPADPAWAGLARWCGAGGLAAMQLMAAWWIWHLAGLRGRGRQRWLAFGLSALVLLHGLGRWASMPSADVKREAKSSSWRVALWQPAVPTREKFEPEQQRQLPARFQSALVAAQQAGAAWLVAPEGALPLQARLLEPAPIPLLTGGFRWLRGQQRSALLLVEAGDRLPSQALDKHRLVPLGEWIPPWLSALPGLSAVGGIEPGDASRLWRWPTPAMAETPIASPPIGEPPIAAPATAASGKVNARPSLPPPAAVAICYELSDGAALAAAVHAGAEWLLAIANLDPYPQLLQRQFRALAQLRSLETARPLLSAANSGPTASVSAQGTVLDQLMPMQPGVLITALQPQVEQTLYVRWRDRPLLMILIVSSFWRCRFGLVAIWKRLRSDF